MLVLFLLILLSNFSLGLAVYLKNPRGRINKIFFAFVLSATVWFLSNYLENESIGLPLAALFLRIDFATASLAAYFLSLFCLSFQRVHFLSSRLRILRAGGRGAAVTTLLRYSIDPLPYLPSRRTCPKTVLQGTSAVLLSSPRTWVQSLYRWNYDDFV